jgi:SNF2 family DNA or RNA helicase
MKMKADYVTRFEDEDETVIAQNAGAVTTKLQQMASGFVYGADKQSIWFDSHKFDRLDELLNENQRANTLIWYTYQEELAELKRRYPGIQTPDDHDVVNRWNKGEIPLLAAHPKSFGHGINLQGQQHMVFLSLPWSLELYEQAVGRLHRGGQKHDVWVYILLTTKTIDERIWAALHDKRSISELAIEELKND